MKEKKVHNRKKKIHRFADHKPSLYFTLFRYSISIAAAFLLAIMIYPLLPKQAVPCANSISCKTPPKFEVETNAMGIFNNQPVRAPNIYLSQNESASYVLGESISTVPKHIYVNLDTETLEAYEGDKLFMKTLVSTGLWGKTPKGDFTIWSKFRSTRMTGGSGADYYDLPNVPYVMFFSNDEVPGSTGFSIHGTYWHNNFGHAMSHGCVNMKTTDVAKLYEWADGPVTITIYDNSQT